MLGMEQMYKMALDPRIFPDSRLLAVMQGKDQSLPMAVAMAAKQQRDKLMQASAGQQAQQGAKQPTVKDQMLARDLPPEHAGLAALPAENMQGMGSEQMMAAGGIVAFDDNKDQPVKSDMPATNPNELYIPPVSDFDKKVFHAITHPGESLQAVKDYMYSDPQSKVLSKIQSGRLTPADVAPPATTPTINSTPTAAELATLQQGGPQNPNASVGAAPAGTPGTPVVKAPGAPAGGPGIGNPPGQTMQSGQPSPLAAAYKEFMNGPDPFANLASSQADHDKKIAEAKSQGLGSFLMNMGAKVMSTVGPLGKALGEGATAGLPSLENSYKVVRELDNNREQFHFNLAKAKELRAQGKIEAAIKYENANTDLMYKTGQLAVEHEKNAMMAPYYSAYAGYLGSGKGKDPDAISLEKATEQWNKIKPGELRKLNTLGITGPAQYREYLVTGKAPLNVTGTIPEGAPTVKLNQG